MAGGWLIASFIPLLLLMVIVASGARTMVLGLRLPRELRESDAPGVCGGCGYAVSWGHGETCPECGRRHAEAGILTPPLAKRMRPSVSSVIAGWTLLALIGSMVLSWSAAMLAAMLASVPDETTQAIASLAGAGVGLLVYVAGIVWILRRRRRIFAGAAPPAAEGG